MPTSKMYEPLKSVFQQAVAGLSKPIMFRMRPFRGNTCWSRLFICLLRQWRALKNLLCGYWSIYAAVAWPESSDCRFCFISHSYAYPAAGYPSSAALNPPSPLTATLPAARRTRCKRRGTSTAGFLISQISINNRIPPKNLSLIDRFYGGPFRVAARLAGSVALVCHPCSVSPPFRDKKDGGFATRNGDTSWPIFLKVHSYHQPCPSNSNHCACSGSTALSRFLKFPVSS